MMQIKIYSSLNQVTNSNSTHTEVTIANAASADGSPLTVNVLGLNPQLNLQGESTNTAGGKKLNAKGYRYGMTAKLSPFEFGSGYSTGLANLIAKLNSNYLYIQFYNYTQGAAFVSDPSTRALSVSLIGIDYEHDYDHKRKFVTLNFESYGTL